MDGGERYEFVVDRPPDSLSANSRAGWGAKHSAAAAYQLEQGASVLAQITAAGKRIPRVPYEFGRLSTSHIFSRHAADGDNCVAVLKPIIDMLQVATRGSRERYRLGIIKNDRKLETEQPTRVSYSRSGAGRIRCVLEVW